MGARSNRAASAERRTRPPKARRAAPPRGSDAAAFELLRSKLAIPSLRPKLLKRPALVNRLRAASEARVFSITAPAGYGKSTLVAQWAERDPRPFAWVSLESRDDDPVALLTYIAAALDGIHPVDPSVFRAAAAASDSLWSLGLPRVSAALASMPEPVVLVLDDVHELHHRDCIDLLEPLAKNLGPGSQLVLSGRGEHGAPLARIRADRRLFEVGPAELALGDEEAWRVLKAVGLEVSKAEAAALNAQAEGWVAGLHLAALFMQESGDPEPVAAFHGDDRFVADYLKSEHLSSLKRTELEFLLRTSILDRMCAPLCDDLVERGDSAKRLQTLEEGNFFVVALDHHREWFRYHRLFRDMLRAELEHGDPDLARALHRRASSWYEANGDPAPAIDHAFAGGDVDSVARLVGSYAMPFFRSGRVATVERWLAAFDDPVLLSAYPAVAAFGAWIHALRGRPEDADRFAYALEHPTYQGPMPDGSASPAGWAALVRAMLCRHGLGEMERDAALAVDELHGASFWRPSALLLHAVGILLQGDEDSGSDLLEQAAEAAVGSGAIYVGVVAHAELALLALRQNDLTGAADHLARAEDFLQNQPIDDYVPAAMHLAASARLALDRGQAATARSFLVSAMRLRGYLSAAIPWFGIQTALELARAHLSIGDVEGARTLALEAEDVLAHRGDVGILKGQLGELRAQLANAVAVEDGWASTLTAAELRLLPLLTTHLSFREIAERLFVSRNTVKSQAISVYRKLGASSRSEAIERAGELGLVDAPVSSPASFTRTG
jgi:LuxR family transcriptional regulator, maltose regulon positive regulatory protein